MKIMIGSDHHGVKTRLNLGRFIQEKGHIVIDCGPKTENLSPVDYPDIAAQVASAVSNKEVDRGILICGTGIGMSIVANKFPGVRAAPVADEMTAEMSRRHNDLNILCLSGDMLSEETIDQIVDIWLKSQFAGGRHERRVNKISLIETEQIKINKEKTNTKSSATAK